MQNLGEFLTEFFFGNYVSQIVNAFILILFAMTFISLIKHIIDLRREENTFNNLSDAFKKLSNNISLNQIQKVIESLTTDSVIKKRIESIHRIRAREGKVDIDVINHITDNSPLPSAVFAKNIMGSFVLIGLMGTIIGLSMALGKMSSSVIELSDNLRVLTENLNGILAGMNTAFSTTASGLLATFLVLIFIYVYNRSLNQLNDRVDTFFATYVINIYQPIHSDNAMQHILESMKNNVKNSQVLSDRLLKTTTNASSQYDALLGVASTFQSGTQNIITHFEETSKVQQEIKVLVEFFTDIAKNFNENSKDFAEKYSTIMERMQQLVGQTQQQNESISDLLTDSRENREQIGQLNTQLAENTREFNQVNAELKNVVDGLKETNESTGQKINQLLDTTTNKLNELLESTNRNLGNFIKASDQNANELLQSLVTKLDDKFGGLTSALQTQFKDTIEDQIELHQEASNLGKNILDNLSETTKVIKENTWGQALNESITGNTESVSELTKQVASYAEQANSIVETLNRLNYEDTNNLLKNNTDALTNLTNLIERRGIISWFKRLFS